VKKLSYQLTVWRCVFSYSRDGSTVLCLVHSVHSILRLLFSHYVTVCQWHLCHKKSFQFSLVFEPIIFTVFSFKSTKSNNCNCYLHFKELFSLVIIVCLSPRQTVTTSRHFLLMLNFYVYNVLQYIWNRSRYDVAVSRSFQGNGKAKGQMSALANVCNKNCNFNCGF